MFHFRLVQDGLIAHHYTYADLGVTEQDFTALRHGAAISEAQSYARQLAITPGHWVVVSLLRLIREEGVRLHHLNMSQFELVTHLQLYLDAVERDDVRCH
jgi:hypothetical protein